MGSPVIDRLKTDAVRECVFIGYLEVAVLLITVTVPDHGVLINVTSIFCARCCTSSGQQSKNSSLAFDPILSPNLDVGLSCTAPINRCNTKHTVCTNRIQGNKTKRNRRRSLVSST